LPGSCESRDLLIACHRNLKYQFLKILFLLHSRTGTCASLGEGKEKLVWVKCRSMELMVENDDSKEERVNNHKKKRVTSMHLKN
jgi:hypothetical protein